MIISKQDRKKLVSLLERYGYAKMSNFNVLNEAFESNILAILEKINSREHIGISGKQEQALSPVGAAFMKAFPIPWHLIKDDQISITYNRRMLPFMPNKEAETNFENTINLPNNSSRDDYNRINTTNYVSNPLVYEQQSIKSLLKKINADLREIRRKYIDAAKSIGLDNPNSKNNAWIDSMQYVKTIYDKNRDGGALNFLILSATSMFLKSVLSSQFVSRKGEEDAERDNLFRTYVKLKDLKYPYSALNNEENNAIIERAFKLYDKYKEVDPDTQEVKRWGIQDELRTANDDTKESKSLTDMTVPRVSEVLDYVVDKGIITQNDVSDFYENSIFAPNDNIENIGILKRVFRNYYFDKHGYEYEDEDGVLLKDDYNHKIAKINDGIDTANKNIRKEKGEKNTEVSKILGTLYNNGTPWKESARASISASIVESIQDWYSNINNFDNYKLAIITDDSFRILYVFSCILFEDRKVGYGINSKAIYGWKYGMEPKLEQGDAEITKNQGKVVYDFSELNPEVLKADKNVSCAILITVNQKDSKSEDLAIFDSNIDKINADIKNAIDNSEKPYEVSADGKQVTINSINNKSIEKLFDLFDEIGVKYSKQEDKENNRMIVTFEDNSNEDTLKLADLMNTLSLKRFYEKNGLSTLFSNLKKRFSQKIYFEDTESIQPKVFGEFYDKQLRGKGENDKYYEDEFIDPTKKVVSGIINAYNQDGNNQSLYQIYIGKRTDSIHQRIIFDRLFKERKYDEIIQDINNAQKEINDIFSKILPNFDFNMKFDIKNVLGEDKLGNDVYARGFDVISGEQLKRSQRSGIKPHIMDNNPVLVKYVNSTEDYADNIDKISLTDAIGADKHMTDVFKAINKMYKGSPYNFFGGKFDTLKGKVSEGLRVLAGDLKRSKNTSEDIDKIYKTITSMYNDYLSMMDSLKMKLNVVKLDKELEKSDVDKGIYNVTDAATVIMQEIEKFYTKYNTYLLKY